MGGNLLVLDASGAVAPTYAGSAKVQLAFRSDGAVIHEPTKGVATKLDLRRNMTA